MCGLLVMLIVAMVPTSKFDWADEQASRPNITAPARCAFASDTPQGLNSLSTMITSVLLMAIGFATRVVRLHKYAVVSEVDNPRKFCSEKAKARLKILSDWSNKGSEAPISIIRRALIYRPALASFLVVRVTLDIYASMLFEVGCSTDATDTH